jgi:hypothetical protein
VGAVGGDHHGGVAVDRELGYRGVSNLGKAGTVTLDASGNGTVTFGPSDNNRGPQTWDVTALIWNTTRGGVSAAGQAPIPRIQVFVDSTALDNVQAQSYDGSFGSAHGSATLVGNQQIIAIWTGGQAGDIASLTVTGEAH